VIRPQTSADLDSNGPPRAWWQAAPSLAGRRRARHSVRRVRELQARGRPRCRNSAAGRRSPLLVPAVQEDRRSWCSQCLRSSLTVLQSPRRSPPLSALVVVGIVAGAPSSGAGGEGADPAGGDAGPKAPTRATQDGADDDDPDDPAGDRTRRGDGDDDDDDADLPEEIRNDPKRLRTHLRRTQRQFGAVRPIADRFRDPDTGQYMPPQEIDRVLGRAQDMEELERSSRSTRTSSRRSSSGAAAEDNRPLPRPPTSVRQDPFANPTILPWDTNRRPRVKKFLELFRDRAREARAADGIKRLEGRSARSTSATRPARSPASRRRGKPPRSRPRRRCPRCRAHVCQRVWRAFELAKTRGQLGKVNVQQVLDSRTEALSAGQSRPPATDRRRRAARAEHNTTIPRPGPRADERGTIRRLERVGTIRTAEIVLRAHRHVVAAVTRTQL
jgi:hypothetical protein